MGYSWGDYRYGGSSGAVTFSSDNTTTNLDYTTWSTTTTTECVIMEPSEYKLEYDGKIYVKKPEPIKGWGKETEWIPMEEMPDPLEEEVVAKPKKRKSVKAKIKVDKKIRVDVEEVADMLF